MTHLFLISLLPESNVAGQLESLGFSTTVADTPGTQGLVLVEAGSGDEIAKRAENWSLEPSRLVAICADPGSLPAGCLWLTPDLLSQPRGHNLLRAWFSESTEDPVQGLLAQISHDMRSPLSVISTAASLIAKFADDRQKTARYLTLINESSGVLKSLVNDILDYSNIREGEFAFTVSDFQLRHLLASVTDSFKLLVKDPDKLEVSCTVQTEVPDFVHGDPGRLRQVLTNLLNNAIKFTAQGTVSLHASRQDGLLRFEVRDTGVGIKQDALERIFRPYQQADASIHSKFGGTGLGLTICRALVERMKGSIGVQSEPGRGSTFWFTADLPEVKLEQPGALPELRDRTIFVGSANPALFDAKLSSRNTLVVYKTLEDVEENLDAPGVDLHLIDLDLGDFALVGRLAERKPGSVIVVTTSAGQRGDVALCKEKGVRGYLTTPIEPKELEVALALAIAAGATDAVVTKYSAKELLAGAV